jgi:hypothetical protein
MPKRTPKDTKPPRRYSIEITEVETRKPIVWIVVDMADEERRELVDNIMRLAGAPHSRCFIELVAAAAKPTAR